MENGFAACAKAIPYRSPVSIGISTASSTLAITHSHHNQMCWKTLLSCTRPPLACSMHCTALVNQFTQPAFSHTGGLKEAIIPPEDVPSAFNIEELLVRLWSEFAFDNDLLIESDDLDCESQPQDPDPVKLAHNKCAQWYPFKDKEVS
ncbi:hypothetical protein CROQUDRAFT_101870 [Cronartium quercuum f. sp. fusiforme G11]|uniref:Uncharacterized protein n=1 Tax=Cronartium quercuum f. sp. fusiforme G11 TaxID=708437 RepID=A0A9P6N5K7_9BASI|nr:hypothetical protein CROQUDRAFT_101870 [Cronartium quercuum f. sp. fusiforme G11]